MTTIDLTQLTNDAVAKAIEDGALKAALDKGVTTAIKDIVDRATGYSSPFRKVLEETIREAMEFDPKAAGLTGYNAAILEIIKTKLDAIVDEQLRERFSKDMDDLLVKAPSEITLSKLVEGFKRWVVEDRQADNDYCTISAERTEYGSHWLRLDPKGGRSEWDCRFSFLISSDGVVYSFSDGGQDMKKALLTKGLTGFPRDLFRMMVAGTKVTIDTMDIDNSLIDYSDEGL